MASPTRPAPAKSSRVGTQQRYAVVAVRCRSLAIFFYSSIDSNGSFSPEVCNAIACDPLSKHFLCFEQPMPKGADSYENLNKSSFANWMADEDVQSIDDLELLQPHYKTLNIKVIKCVGLTPILELLKKVKAMGFQQMIGCMTESTIGISAGIVFASFAHYLDLDRANLLTNDVATGLKFVNGKVVISDGAGLVISLIDSGF